MPDLNNEKDPGTGEDIRDIEEFIGHTKNFNINLFPSQIEQIQLYLEELIRWNKKINLISAKNLRELLIRHILDSLVPSSYLEDSCSLLDAGTGAGLPGIPLKILRPDLFVVLVESRRKKVAFNQHILNKLSLSKTEAIWSRIEDAAFIQRFKENQFDGIISRAAMAEEIILKAGTTLLKERGKIILMKGALEPSQQKVLKSKVSEYCRKTISFNPYFLPGWEKEKNIVVIQ